MTQSLNLCCLSPQGSLHYTPEHCLVNGGFPLFWWKKPCFKWAKCIFSGALHQNGLPKKYKEGLREWGRPFICQASNPALISIRAASSAPGKCRTAGPAAKRRRAEGPPPPWNPALGFRLVPPLFFPRRCETRDAQQPQTKTRFSSREVRIPFFPVVFFSRGTLQQKG